MDRGIPRVPLAFMLILTVLGSAFAFLPAVNPTSSASTTTTPSTNSIGSVNIGYFANINHAPAVIGIANGDFQKALGPSTTIHTFLFPSGGPEMVALLAGKLDIAYVGPSPAVNAYIQSNGTGLVILGGVASGGAVFVVQNSSKITSAKDLGGKTFAAPGIGNTQDIALRYYLMENGYKTTTNGGNVTVLDATNANIVTLFAEGKVDGAWVPEPYGEVLMQQLGGKLFLDERSLWPGGSFSTAELVVRTQFLQQHADVVQEIVSADVAETNWINKNPSLAEADLNSSLVSLTGQGYSQSILGAALARLAFTYDPLETSVAVQAEHAWALGDLTQNPTNLSGLYDLSVLSSVLAADGLPGLSTTSVSCSHASVLVGTTTSCKATVQGTGSAATGTVTWSGGGSGSFSSAPCKLSPQKSFSTCSAKFTPTVAGSPLTITASYGGDPKNAPSAGAYSLTVTLKVTRTTVSCKPTSAVAGSSETITCTARVTGNSPRGTVSWSQSGSGSVSFNSTACTLASVGPTQGTCSVTMTGKTAGRVTGQATYGGNRSNQGSSGTFRLTIKDAT